MANISTDKAIFTMTPAPSGQNQSKEIWNGYLNDTVDEINVVNMRTNELVGTIGGGNAYYKFDKLPTSYIARTVYDGEVIGDVIDYEGTGSLPPYSDNQYQFRLENGNLSYITNIVRSHFTSGIFLFTAYDIQTDIGYFVAFKINDNDKTLLEKVAEVEMSNQFFNYGYNYTYQPKDVDNECYFIYHIYPTSDSVLLESYQTKLTITESNGIYTLTSEDIVLNYGGKTVLELYNENAPSPVSGVDWIYRTPMYSGSDDYNNMLNGRDEAWIWYGNYNSGTSTLFPYIAGFNIVTGETAYIEPINSLANTTNFNPVGTVDYTYFTNNWQSHPAGVYFGVYNQQPLDNLNNTNGVTALYSPRWENNDKVTFLTQRSYFISGDGAYNGKYLHTNGFYFDSIPYIYQICFDSENITFIVNYDDSSYNQINYWISRFKLDSNEKIEESVLLPVAFNMYGSSFVGYNTNDACIISCPDESYSAKTFSKSSYIYWQIGSDKPYQLQSNNNAYQDYETTPFVVIGNKFFSGISMAATPLAIQYDEYKKVVI